MMTPAQCRAARGLLRWSQSDLADKAGVSLSTVKDFETEQRNPRGGNLEAMQQALEAIGVEFIDRDNGGPGVRMRE